jgi:uncharacterized protein involved in response to NO
MALHEGSARPTRAGEDSLRWHGTALFNLGFRPFYLLAALLAAAAVPLWVAEYFGLMPRTGYLSGLAWHAHEMVFGFAVAVIAGFLFTAARNWTGLPTPTHGPLAALAGLWLAGRVLLVTGPGWLAAIVDVSFLPAIALGMWLPLQRSRNRNRFFVALLLVLAVANLGFHLAQTDRIPIGPIVPVRFALYLVVIIITIMAGRVIPSFTQNAIPNARIRRNRTLDLAAIAGAALALGSALLTLPAWIVAPLCLVASGLQAGRLWMWDPWCTRHRPILWILHVSYAWIAVALLVMGLTVITAAVPAMLADHALSVGAVGGMIIGMITRTARGHVGMPLQASRSDLTAYVLVHLAAAIRVLLPLAWPAGYGLAVSASSALWSAAFVLYLLVYAPILARPREDAKPG